MDNEKMEMTEQNTKPASIAPLLWLVFLCVLGAGAWYVYKNYGTKKMPKQNEMDAIHKDYEDQVKKNKEEADKVINLQVRDLDEAHDMIDKLQNDLVEMEKELKKYKPRCDKWEYLLNILDFFI